MIGLGIGLDTGRSFSPSQLSGMVAWFDAYRGITSSGGNITTWADQSGAGNDLTGVSNEAQFSASGGPNATPTVVFAAHGALATVAPLITGTDAARTYAIVCQSSDTADLMGFFYDGSLSGTGIGYVINDTGSSKRNLYIPAGVAADTTSNLTTSFESIVIQNHNLGAVSGNQSLTVGGVAHTLDVSNKSLVAATSAFFLGGTRAASGFFVNGKVCEFIAFNRALSAAERASLQAWFHARWGV